MVAHEPMYVSSHSHSIYPTARNTITYGHDHNLAYGHEHAPAYGHAKPISADERQLHTVVKFYVLDEKVFLPQKLEIVRRSRKEVGCIAYELFKNADEKAADNYALFSIWRTSEDEERHERTPYIQAGLAGVEREKMDLISPRDTMERRKLNISVLQ